MRGKARGMVKRLVRGDGGAEDGTVKGERDRVGWG
jgi:hypothetical protein